MITKIFLLTFTVYTFIAIIVSIIDHPKYIYIKKSPFLAALTSLIQPASNLIAHGKITHFWHWKTISSDQVSQHPYGMQLNSHTSYRNSDNGLVRFIQSIATEVFLVKDVAILKPIHYSGNWTVSFCDEDEFCQQSTLLYSLPIQILLD